MKVVNPTTDYYIRGQAIADVQVLNVDSHILVVIPAEAGIQVLHVESHHKLSSPRQHGIMNPWRPITAP